MFPLLLALAAPVQAKELDGVTMPDTVSLGGQTITINGMGLREKYWIDIYVAGLYVQHTSHDAATLIAADEPKQLTMHFIYSKVTNEQLVDAWKEDFDHNPAAAAQKANIDTFLGWMPAQVVSGDELVYTYVPGTGTSVALNGKSLGTIAGVDFMKLIWNVWLGDHPPTENLKTGLLGN